MNLPSVQCLSFGHMTNPGKYFMQLEETEMASLSVLEALEIAWPMEHPLAASRGCQHSFTGGPITPGPVSSKLSLLYCHVTEHVKIIFNIVTRL